MTKLMNLDLQNAEILDKDEMKRIAGGENANCLCTAAIDDDGNPICFDRSTGGRCHPSGGDESYPKIEACKGKKPNDPCTVTLQGIVYNCTCVDFGSGLFCSTFPIYCR